MSSNSAEVIHLRDRVEQHDVISRFKRWYEHAPPEVRRQIRAIVRVDGEPWRQRRDEAIQVLDWLNKRRSVVDPGKRGYHRSDRNLRFIAQRLVEGATVQECKAVVAVMARAVQDGSFDPLYFRPETLFNATKFESYRARLEAGDDE